MIAELLRVGTFDPTAFNEVRQNGAPSIGADGFVPPSLLSVFAFPQTFFHNGSAASLDQVMAIVAHRSAGTPGNDTLQDPAKRAQLIKFLQSIDASTPPISPADAVNVTITSAATDIGPRLAPESIGSAYGTGLAVQSAGATVTPPPVALVGTTASVRDSGGSLRLGQLFYVSPNQVNFLLPAATAPGTAEVIFTAGSGATSHTTVEVSTLAPAIFTAPGTTIAAATAVSVAADGTQTPVTVVECGASGSCSAVPVDLGPPGQSVFVTFFGTGLRKNSGVSNVHATVGDVDAPVLFAGPQGEFVGLDQINVQLPDTLRGRGQVPVVFTIDGQTTKPVDISIR